MKIAKTYPVCTRRQCVRRRSDAQRDNLSWIQPGHTEPADGEESIEDEEEEGGYDAGFFAANAVLDVCIRWIHICMMGQRGKVP